MKKFTILIMTVLLLIGSPQYIFGTEHNSTRTGELVIVLDPGHDLTHGGASGNGLSESKLNFIIAEYCYEELSTYSNVKVYMTRDSLECPHPEVFGANNEVGKDNEKRVKFAASVNADAYVSLHLNSFSDPSINGAEVYVPNTNYRSELGKEGKALGESILNQLEAVGLKRNGVYTRNSEDGTRYPDGSIADYYGVIKNAKKAGMTGIIIEHAYISSPGDAANFLSTEAQLKALGVADATGIAEYYGLVKGTEGGGSQLPDEPESESEEEPETEAESETETQTETELETETESEPETQTETEGEAETETQVETETESETETQPETETEGETETQPETETEGETETQTETEIETETTAQEPTETFDNSSSSQGASFDWGVVLVMALGCVVCIVIIVILLKKIGVFQRK